MREHGLHVVVRPGDGTREPPLLLMNGIGASVVALQPFVDALSPAREVIRFDAPGIGQSPKPSRPYLLAGLARRVARMLDGLGHERVDVLGISWGGLLAQQFAVQHAKRCRRLILVSTAPGWMAVPGKPRALVELIRPRRHHDQEHLTKVAPKIYGGVVREHPEWARIAGLGSGPSQRGYHYQQLAVLGWASLPFLRFIRQPTLILGGDDDPIVPEVNTRIMAKRIPNAGAHVFSDGHLGLLTSAHELAPLVEEFLDSDSVSDDAAGFAAHLSTAGAGS